MNRLITFSMIATASAFLIGGLLAVFALPAPQAAETPKAHLPAPSPLALGAQETITGSYLAGRFAQRRKDFSAANDHLKAALSRAPDAPDLLRQTFLVALIGGNMNDAVRLAERYVEEAPEQALAQYTVVAERMRQGKFQAAQDILDALPNTGLNVFAKPLLRAWTLVGLGRHDAGIKELEKLSEDQAATNISDIHLALIHDLKGDAAAAKKAYTRVVERQSAPSPRVTQLLGGLYERTGEQARAEALYQLYLAERPESRVFEAIFKRAEAGKTSPRQVKTAQDGAAEAFYGLSNSLSQQRVGDTAIALARLTLHLKPDFPPMQYLLAEILESEGHYEQAIAMYLGIRETSGYRWGAELNAALLEGEVGRMATARTRLSTLAKARPELPDPHIQLGDLLRGREDYADAVLAYDEAVDRIPAGSEDKHWGVYYARGIALERSKNWPRAEKDLLKALSFQPEHPYVLNYLGYSWIDQGLHLDRATEMIKKAVSLAPRDGFIADSLGWAFYRLGKFEEAVAELERAIELEPGDPTINDHLGDAYWRVGREREARFQWQRALTLKPDADKVPPIEAKLKNGLDG